MTVHSRGLTGDEYTYMSVLSRGLTSDEWKVYECAQSWING